MAAIDRSSVVATVCRHLAEILEIDIASISETQTFVSDLGADSISLIELVDSLEQEFENSLPDFRFEDDDLAQLVTVADAVDYVVRAHGN